jgi:hypothetical protein
MLKHTIDVVGVGLQAKVELPRAGPFEFDDFIHLDDQLLPVALL